MKKYFRNLFTRTLSAKIAGTAMLALAMATSSFAVSQSELFRALDTRTFTGNPAGTGEFVFVTLSDTNTPVVLTWDADLANSVRYSMGWSVNGKPCGAYGPGQIPIFLGSSGYQNLSYQAVINPSDGLVVGLNNFQLCLAPISGGGTISVGYQTISVRKSN